MCNIVFLSSFVFLQRKESPENGTEKLPLFVEYCKGEPRVRPSTCAPAVFFAGEVCLSPAREGTALRRIIKRTIVSRTTLSKRGRPSGLPLVIHTVSLCSKLNELVLRSAAVRTNFRRRLAIVTVTADDADPCFHCQAPVMGWGVLRLRR